MSQPQTGESPSGEPSPPSLFSTFFRKQTRQRRFQCLPTLGQSKLGQSKLGKTWGWLVASCVLGGVGLATPAQAALQLRVAVEEGTAQVQVGTSAAAIVRDSSGRQLGQMGAMAGSVAQRQGSQVSLGNWNSSQIWVEPQDGGYVWIGDRWYRGRALLSVQDGAILAVNYVDLEQYLYSVVGGEMPTNWPLEALKAQAVAARSYALHRRNTRGNVHYDLGDTTAWQVYKGLGSETTTTQAAVSQTAGQVLTHNGTIIEAVFHSSSGGHTENVEDVWSKPLPYLRGVTDFDQYAPVFQWQETFSAAQMRQRVTGVGNVISMTPISVTPQGRVREMKVVGDAGQRILSGNELRRALDLRSALFRVAPTGSGGGSNKSALPTSFVVQGRGFGHGLGMSQWGAYGLANQGYNYQQILGHYYQNASLARIQVTP
ncbi:MAG: SpoIID/LytB domain-containing protein [Prochlorothrix sp.]|nr:SpoIID/LytB domain-containing protein [Prochlorothrix sp.]